MLGHEGVAEENLAAIERDKQSWIDQQWSGWSSRG